MLEEMAAIIVTNINKIAPFFQMTLGYLLHMK